MDATAHFARLTPAYTLPRRARTPPSIPMPARLSRGHHVDHWIRITSTRKGVSRGSLTHHRVGLAIHCVYM